MRLKQETIDFIRAEHRDDKEALKALLADENKHIGIIEDLKAILADASPSSPRDNGVSDGLDDNLPFSERPRPPSPSPGKKFDNNKPRTDKDLVRQGFRFKNESTCRDCGETIEWWQTPRGKSIPLDPDDHIIHFETCEAKQ